MSRETALQTDLYAPREAWFVGPVTSGPITIKLSAICARGKSIAPSLIERAEAKIAAEADRIAHTDHCGAGFAVLHGGEEGVWLLLHWWIAGGISTRILWRADNGDAEFLVADPLLMACVWELGIIDFERRAWMRTAMSGAPIADYLSDRFSEGTV